MVAWVYALDSQGFFCVTFDIVTSVNLVVESWSNLASVCIAVFVIWIGPGHCADDMCLGI